MKRSLILATALFLPALAFAGPKQFDATDITSAIQPTSVLTVRKTGFYQVFTVHTAPSDFLPLVRNCVQTSLELTRAGADYSVTLPAQLDGFNPEVRYLQLQAGDVLSVRANTILCSYDIKYSLHVAVEEFATFKR